MTLIYQWKNATVNFEYCIVQAHAYAALDLRQRQRLYGRILQVFIITNREKFFCYELTGMSLWSASCLISSASCLSCFR